MTGSRVTARCRAYIYTGRLNDSNLRTPSVRERPPLGTVLSDALDLDNHVRVTGPRLDYDLVATFLAPGEVLNLFCTGLPSVPQNSGRASALRGYSLGHHFFK